MNVRKKKSEKTLILISTNQNRRLKHTSELFKEVIYLYKTLSQIICLLGLCIGLYKTDILSIAIFFSILAGCVWLIPNIISVIFKEKKNDDGVIYVESMDDGKTEFHLAIKSPITAIKKDYLTIKVEVPKNLWEDDDNET